ncbi:MAG: acetolactate synthase small subunit [Anaerolineales bacterium]
MNERMKSTLVLLVENKPGVLNRVVSLFRRRNFNMDSLTVGRTHRPDVSRMTIVMDTEGENDAKKVIMNLYKMVDVIEVQDVTEVPNVKRDLALVKLSATNPGDRNSLTEITYKYGARIVDIGPDVVIVEITGEPAHVENTITALEPFGIREIARTGVVSLGRGVRTLRQVDYESKRSTRAITYHNGNGTQSIVQQDSPSQD